MPRRYFHVKIERYKSSAQRCANVKCSFGFGTYFLFWVRGLRSDQDEGKYQDGGYAFFLPLLIQSGSVYRSPPVTSASERCLSVCDLMCVCVLKVHMYVACQLMCGRNSLLE